MYSHFDSHFDVKRFLPNIHPCTDLIDFEPFVVKFVMRGSGVRLWCNFVFFFVDLMCRE